MTKIILTWPIAGTLDFAGASLMFILQTHKNPGLLLKAITAAAIGPRAFDDGKTMAMTGLLLHYVIALVWTIDYFAVFTRLFTCTAVFINAVVYGIFIWVIMILMVLPLSKAEPRPFSPVMALINMAILIRAIGLPCGVGATF
ncbi:DUF1440 domain-containing protein [Mucilaginibacter endophyticus]|uniref:DUF1440 domain-containing protein n=1 Tax=Mucilaginibacter endophyticus TaxID=2675003 RepID=UPI000E0D0FBC|nr:DUF1440 domain-containing protein [Mucilaginibacter endophyticus]